ncbi:MAG TPA: ABC transporter permease, partial [Bacteroidota bacterium]|nr:ABC transporter permease [Bacteroidota bacterium]
MANFLTELKEGLAISFRAIRANKMRSALTMLGIFIGIVSVTLMATAIEGVNRAFEKSAEAFGTDVLYIQKFPWVSNDDWSTIRNRRMLEVSYAARIERQSMFAGAVAPVIGTNRRVTYGDNSMDGGFISGTTAQYLATAGVTLGDGRFFTVEEAQGGRPVCVVGANVVENL